MSNLKHSISFPSLIDILDNWKNSEFELKGVGQWRLNLDLEILDILSLAIKVREDEKT